MTSLASAIGNALRGRDVPSRIAAFAAQSAVAVFATAYDDWAEDTTGEFSELMQRSLADLRHAVGFSQADGNYPRTGSPQDLTS